MDCKIIVIDLGSGSCKIGFAGEEHPRFTFPTIVGRLKKERRMSLGLVEHNTNQNKIFVGDECDAAKLDINYPIINGTIDDWDGVKAILNYAFQHLGMSDEITHFPVIMTDSIYSKRDSRHKMAKLMFHTYHVPAFYIDYQPFFSLISNPGKNTGIIIEIGDGITQIFPCVGGYLMKKGMIKFPIGGSMITHYLMKNLNCPDLCTKNHLKDLSIIKKECCRFAVDYDEESKNIKPIKYMHLKHSIQIGIEQINATEIFFQPFLGSSQEKGLHEIINDAILECNENIQILLYKNIILAGGISAMNGLAERLKKELKILAPNYSNDINIISLPNPSESAWVGASEFARFPVFFLQEFAVSKKNYDQKGDDIIDEKCFSLGNKTKI